MTLPTFLGIGSPKAGSTWLYELLKDHPQVYMPAKIKDIRFFDLHYENGIDWYEHFFPAPDVAEAYKAMGEYSAAYIYGEDAPQRISQDLDRPKLLLMLRNPVDRTYSLYKHEVRYKNYPNSFEQFLIDRPRVTRDGGAFIARHIKRYQEYFGPDQLMIRLSDQVYKDVEKARTEFAMFLDIDPTLFEEGAGQSKKNESFVPRFRAPYAMIAKSVRWLNQEQNVYWPTYVGRRLGFKKLIAMGGTKPEPMREETRRQLQGVFEQEVSDLEAVLDTDLSHWRS